MKIEQHGNRLEVTLSEGECTGDLDITVKVTEGGTDRYALAFLTPTTRPGQGHGVDFKLVVKRGDFHDEVTRTALATYGEPVKRD